MTETDLPFSATVYASARYDELELTGWSPDQKAIFVAQQHAAQHRHYRQHYDGAQWLIIESGGRPAGRLFRIVWPEEIRVIDISLLPEARGSGIGTAILVSIQAEAAQLGRAVTVHVEKNNPARRLYQRLGFAVAADKGVYDLMRWVPTHLREAS